MTLLHRGRDGTIVNGGSITRLDPQRVCIQGPDRIETCFRRGRESRIPPGVKRGDLVRVRVVHGVVTEVEEIEVDLRAQRHDGRRHGS